MIVNNLSRTAGSQQPAEQPKIDFNQPINEIPVIFFPKQKFLREKTIDLSTKKVFLAVRAKKAGSRLLATALIKNYGEQSIRNLALGLANALVPEQGTFGDVDEKSEVIENPALILHFNVCYTNGSKFSKEERDDIVKKISDLKARNFKATYSEYDLTQLKLTTLTLLPNGNVHSLIEKPPKGNSNTVSW